MGAYLPGDGHAAHKCAVPGEEDDIPGHAHQLALFGQAGVLPDQEKVLYTCPKEVRCSILLQYRYIVTHRTNFSHMTHISSQGLLYYIYCTSTIPVGI